MFGGFLTYPLLALVGDVHMLRSSVEAQISAPTLLALAGVPLLYLALVAATLRLARRCTAVRGGARASLALALLVVWVLAGQQSFARDWTTRRDRQVAANAQWVFVSSWWQTIAGDGAVRMAGSFTADDLADFEPLRQRAAARAARRRRAASA